MAARVKPGGEGTPGRGTVTLGRRGHRPPGTFPQQAGERRQVTLLGPRLQKVRGGTIKTYYYYAVIMSVSCHMLSFRV